ncbi:MAG: methyltransferase protein [Solirubrobacterales bacterium]|nr:methyltransferase protein [Solirubrobacterales bacterium]
MSDADADDLRAAQREHWSRAALGWTRRRPEVQRFAEPVSRWMLHAVQLAPGQRVLELAAGAGETGLIAAQRIGPGGTLVATDMAEEMLEGIRSRAEELGLDNVETRRMELEWIDAPAASFDAVLCRWGLMFAVDVEAALREIRRVLKPGGRLAAATWSGPEENQWGTAIQRTLLEQGHVDAPPDLDAPGPFRLREPSALVELARSAGLADVEVEPIDIVVAYGSVDEFLGVQRDLSVALSDVLERVDERSRTALRDGVAEKLAPHTAHDGSVRIPGRALGLAAGA